MEFDEVEAFVAVVNYGSYRKASKMLSAPVGKPGIARRIKKLEESLGVDLFVKDDRDKPSGRRSRLTDDGHKFLPLAYRLLNAFTEARGSVSHKQTLTIAATRSLCSYVLPDALQAVRVQHPTCMVVVVAAPSTQILELVQTGQANVGLRYARGNIDPDEGNIRIDTFASDPLLLLHKKTANTPTEIDLAKLSKEPLIVFEKGSTSWAITHDLFREAKRYPNVVCEVDSVETAKKLVEQGLGFCFLPKGAVKHELNSGSLTTIDLLNENEDEDEQEEGRRVYNLNRRIELVRHTLSTNAVTITLYEAFGAHITSSVGWELDPTSGVQRQVRRRNRPE